ncbi:probable inactive tRNA-specific adenosine deaminase-like protein 3 isoform X1 [Lytechinus pictus]|uniref:probable inactive tRNA-specific adenosine deaminase-like protein 3 isoform X1 n=1 Tax=Lytechinus pictus TaxID=7653 RepID=UPI0030B9DBAD
MEANNGGPGSIRSSATIAHHDHHHPIIKKRRVCESKLKVDEFEEGTDSRLKSTQKEENMRIIPVLPDHVSAPVPLVSVYAAAILDKKKTSFILRKLSDVYPLEGLSHIKRVRKQTIKNGSDNKDELQVILCESNKVTLPIIDKSSSVIVDGDINKELLGDPFIAYIPRVAPQTKAQFAEASKYWPTAYHEDKELSRLLSGENFSSSDRESVYKNILKAIRKADEATINGKEAIGALIVDPTSDTTLAMTSSIPGKGENPLQHAVMKCIDLVAHSQGGGAWPICQESHFVSLDSMCNSDETPYLCTGFDLYVTQEPCIMCAMALVHSRIRRVFYTNSHPDGALGSMYKLHTETSLNHRYQAFKVDVLCNEQQLDVR